MGHPGAIVVRGLKSVARARSYLFGGVVVPGGTTGIDALGSSACGSAGRLCVLMAESTIEDGVRAVVLLTMEEGAVDKSAARGGVPGIGVDSHESPSIRPEWNRAVERCSAALTRQPRAPG